MARNGRTWIALAAFLLAGCAARKPAGNWTIQPVAQGHILIPPLAQPGRPVLLRSVCPTCQTSRACGIAMQEVQLVWRGGTARVEVQPQFLAPPRKATVTGRGEKLAAETVQDLSWWSRFYLELIERERSGCLRPGEADRLAARILENLALPSGLAYQLRFHNPVIQGYFDLEPQVALKAVAPLLKPGVERYRSLHDVRGYETVYYELARQRGRLRIQPVSIEDNMGGKVAASRRLSSDRLKLPDSVRAVRYFFRVWKTTGDRKIALLSTPRAELLDRLTARFLADPEAFCRAAQKADATCISIPNEMMLAPEMKVRANGKTAYVPVGGSLGTVLQGAGVQPPESVLARLTVLRPYGGELRPVEFDRSRRDVLGLVLIGGEEIRW